MEFNYEVTYTGTYTVTVQVAANSEDEAIAIAEEAASIQSYCGNGGCDKLIGVEGWLDNAEASIDPGYSEFESVSEI